MTLPSFLAASISSGGPKFWAAAGPPAAASAAPSASAPNWRFEINTTMRFISLICILVIRRGPSSFRAARAA